MFAWHMCVCIKIRLRLFESDLRIPEKIMLFENYVFLLNVSLLPDTNKKNAILCVLRLMTYIYNGVPRILLFVELLSGDASIHDYRVQVYIVRLNTRQYWN